MHAKTLVRRWWWVGLAVLVGACTTPPPPPPGTTTWVKRSIVNSPLRPNVMLLLDTSGSMDFQVDPNCTTGCATRLSDVKGAMATFLAASGSTARWGLATFPSGSRCEPTNAVEVPLPPPSLVEDAAQSAINQANADAINTRVQSIAAAGGTPTGTSLAYVGALPALNQDDGRQDFVLLVTDGEPNCNPNNANDCNDAAACACTLNSCAGQFCREGCLDRLGVVQQIETLRSKGIRTAVVGFGADVQLGNAPAVLDEMGTAGGFALSCPLGTDAECGANNTCGPSRLCTRRFYAAANEAELAATLQRIATTDSSTVVCRLDLPSVPGDPAALEVVVDGVAVATSADTWAYAAGAIVFQGALCDQLKGTTPYAPVQVEVRGPPAP